MNIEAATDALIDKTKILESIGSGVQLSPFEKVFNCDSVCILRPIMPDGIDWETIVEEELGNIGKEYDDYFNLNDDAAFSCVEVGLDALRKIPDHEKKFHGLFAMIKNEKNLTPDMYYKSGSFEVVLEIKGKW